MYFHILIAWSTQWKLFIGLFSSVNDHVCLSGNEQLFNWLTNKKQNYANIMDTFPLF